MNLFDQLDEKENKDFDCSYAWSDMANFMTDCGIPHGVVKKLADNLMAMIMKRPILDVFEFDDYLHEKYGNYEDQGKSQEDIFKELFGDKIEQAKYYFGLSK